MSTLPLTVKQKHWLLHLDKYRGPCFKVPINVGDGLVSRGFAKEARAPLVARTGYAITAKGEHFAKTGEQ